MAEDGLEMKRILLISIITLCLVGCAKHDKTPKEQAPLRVNTMVVAPQAGTSTSRYVGTIAPVQETPLSIQSAGRVTAIHAKNGDKVRKGQKIVEVEDTQARNALEGAKASLQHAQDGYDRAKQVHDKGVIADQKMVEIESQLSQAQALYASAKQRFEECTLIAPCEGVMSGLELTKGQTVIPGAKVCTILDVSGFSVRFTVPESEINGLTGERISGIVECTAVNQVFPITITEKSETANPVTHTYDVVARIKGGAEVLKTGMVAKVQITNQQSSITNQQSDIVIPARCILLKPGGHTVWLIEQGRAVRRDVVVDGYQADGVRILSGLQPGDSLIIDGYQKLYNNCKIQSEN